ncbi:MAG: hypothetical protein A2293_02580 [Elusimicrobia bacterium RIFOXYB2_FULL_49_7]|nr:MAG: hypothetical protein A2293_02580 [Elusimicrobia bacterium RIFOXYB2_FULL_49_7]
MKNPVSAAVRRPSPEALSRAAALRFMAHQAAEGMLAGHHYSLFHGSSVEFAEHKEYAPGDDVRRLDWRVLGKSDRYYIKKFDQEKQLSALLVMDTSASMDYGSQGLSKMDAASSLALCFAFLLLRQSDQVGLALLSEKQDDWIPPSSQNTLFDRMVELLGALRCGGALSLADKRTILNDRLEKSRVVLLFSDCFFETLEPLESLLKSLRIARKEVLLFQVLDPAELAFPFTLRTRFLDMESAREITAEPIQVRKNYLNALQAHNTRIRELCLQNGAEYALYDTAQPLPRFLMEFLKTRGRPA